MYSQIENLHDKDGSCESVNQSTSLTYTIVRQLQSLHIMCEKTLSYCCIVVLLSQWFVSQSSLNFGRMWRTLLTFLD